VAAIDQGTASSRCLVFDRSGRIVSVAQKEHHHVYPRPGWVEHDPEEIWRNVEEVVARALSDGRLEPTDLVALGIANQRETTIVWDRQTGQAVHPAINWQDMRTDHIVRALAAGVLLLGTQAALAARHGSGSSLMSSTCPWCGRTSPRPYPLAPPTPPAWRSDSALTSTASPTTGTRPPNGCR
jgi:glycerol kinase